MLNKKQLHLFRVSEIKMSYTSKIPSADRPQVKTSISCFDIFLHMWSDDIEFIETFNILLLNRSNRVMGMVTISKGGVSGTVVDAKMVFAAALKSRASSIILAHNHPSGNLKPSQADISLTKKMVAGGRLLDISVLDHLIVTKEDYYSFADEENL